MSCRLTMKGLGVFVAYDATRLLSWSRSSSLLMFSPGLLWT